MSAGKIVVTRAQLEKLMEELRLSGSGDPTAACLSDGDFIGYVQETLAAGRVTAIEVHIGGCVRCGDRLGELFEVAEAWRGVEGERRLAALQLRLQNDLDRTLEAGGVAKRLAEWHAEIVAGWGAHLDAFTEALRSVRPSLGAAHSHAQEPVDLVSEDASHAAYAVIEADGDLVVRLDSRATALEGTDVTVSAGDWSVVMPLARVAPDTVGVEVRVPQAARKSMSAGARLKVTGAGVEEPNE